MNKLILFYISAFIFVITFGMFSFSDDFLLKEPPFYYKIFESAVLLIFFCASSYLLAKNPRRGRAGHLLFIGSFLLFNTYAYSTINAAYMITESAFLGWMTALVKVAGYGFVLYSSIRLYLEIRENIKSVKHDNEKLRESVYIDQLSGLYNRKYLEEFLGSKEFKDNMESYNIIIVDVDDFKAVNDTYGHSVGDEVIRVCGESILSSIRKDSFGVRYGGEEFIILSKCQVNIPVKIARRVSDKFKSMTKKMSEIEGLKTLSIGISKFGPNKTFEMVFDEADRALYKAKSNGKDKYITHE